MSSASAPSSIASATSDTRSPACGPTMPAPRTWRVSGSMRSFVSPSSRPSPSARPDAAHGNVPFSNGMPSALACVSVSPIQATSGSV